MTTTTAPHSVTTYEDVRKVTTGRTKDESDYRVFVEVQTEGLRRDTIIVGYKKTQRAAQMLSNKIEREHAYGSIASWGWEKRDKFNEGTW